MTQRSGCQDADNVQGAQLSEVNTWVQQALTQRSGCQDADNVQDAQLSEVKKYLGSTGIDTEEWLPRCR